MKFSYFCFKKERIKGKYYYHFQVFDEQGSEVTRFGIESKKKLGRNKLAERAEFRLKKIQKIFKKQK